MSNISLVYCPHCRAELPISRSDFKIEPEKKYCACTNCGKEFPVLEGKPVPPLN